MKWVAAAFLALALAAGAQAATRQVGLYGVVTRGPITPVCVAEQPCSEPAAGAILAFVRNGSVIARVKAGAGGRFRILLAPGLYAVRAGKRALDPDSVRVRRGRMLRVDFAIDTGIR